LGYATAATNTSATSVRPIVTVTVEGGERHSGPTLRHGTDVGDIPCGLTLQSRQTHADPATTTSMSAEADGRGSGSAPLLMMPAVAKPSETSGGIQSEGSQRGGADNDNDYTYDDDHTYDEEVMPLEFEDPGDELCMADEEMTIFVTADSGAVTHVTPPETLPRGVVIDGTTGGRDFVAANNGRIKNHGSTSVELVSSAGKAAGCDFRVAETNRTLHSTSQTCDAGHEVLYMAQGAVVVPAGTLSKHLRRRDVRAQYPRKGGLYVAEMKIRAKRPGDQSQNGGRTTAGFTRPGNKR